MLIDEARQPVSVFSNDGTFPLDGVLSISVFLMAAFTMMKPSSTNRLIILASLNVVQLFLAFPITTNHGTILGVGNLAIVLALVVNNIKKRKLAEGSLYSAMPLLRLLFLILYGTAALSKFNTTFLFDLINSCGITMAEDELYWLPFDIMDLGFATWWFVPWVVALTELAIFVTPMFRLTRSAGIILAVVFHTALSLTANSKGPGFTLVLFALLMLFLSDNAIQHSLDLVRGFRKWLSKFVDSWFTTALWFGFLIVQINISWLSGWGTAPGWRWGGTLAVDLIWSAFLIYIAAKHWREGLSPQRTVGVHSVVGALIVAVTLLNSISPYLGGKTYSTMSMYSNLQVEGGVSNHLLFPRLPIHTPQDDIVTILNAQDPNLVGAKERGEKLTMHEMIRILAKNPESAVQYEFQGKTYFYEHASENPELVTIDPFWHKLIGHRRITAACVW